MDEMWLIIAIAVGILIVITAAFFTRNKTNAFRDNASLAVGMTLVVLGILFGDDRLVGYSFIGVGVLVAAISAIEGMRKK
jgi:hypothetical protein